MAFWWLQNTHDISQYTTSSHLIPIHASILKKTNSNEVHSFHGSCCRCDGLRTKCTTFLAIMFHHHPIWVAYYQEPCLTKFQWFMWEIYEEVNKLCLTIKVFMWFHCSPSVPHTSCRNRLQGICVFWWSLDLFMCKNKSARK